MNPTRLMILDLPAAQGPLHGHEIRRVATYTDVSEWGGVGVGAIHRELRQADAAELIKLAKATLRGRRSGPRHGPRFTTVGQTMSRTSPGGGHLHPHCQPRRPSLTARLRKTMPSIMWR
ncbi:hypothetical protein ACLQ2R_25450 [Streptosporangium sp. DT93]|uniref:hypothetical protein n=1 Tax=Streptosporangium sp. DT93 TaxID=3393428 RepID=UPI003CF785EE